MQHRGTSQNARRSPYGSEGTTNKLPVLRKGLRVYRFRELQNPPARRELEEFPIATQEFVRSAKTPYNFLEKWLEIPDLEIPDNIRGKDDGDGEEDEEDGAEGDGDEGD